MLQRLISRFRRLTRPGDARDQLMKQESLFVADLLNLSGDVLKSFTVHARRATEQRTHLLELVNQNERVGTLCDMCGRNSREIVILAERLAEDAEVSAETTAGTARDMLQLANTLSASVELMQLFSQRIAEVDSMVTTIGEISRQTNLLALNAAIEAANAGKKGDGFSVIAREIGLLADRTEKSTIDLGNRTELMCLAARDAEGAMQKSKVAVEHGIEQTLAVEQSFHELQNVIRQVDFIAGEAAVASGQGITLLNRAAQSMRKIDDLALSCTNEADVFAEAVMRITECSRLLEQELPTHR